MSSGDVLIKHKMAIESALSELTLANRGLIEAIHHGGVNGIWLCDHLANNWLTKDHYDFEKGLNRSAEIIQTMKFADGMEHDDPPTLSAVLAVNELTILKVKKVNECKAKLKKALSAVRTLRMPSDDEKRMTMARYILTKIGWKRLSQRMAYRQLHIIEGEPERIAVTTIAKSSRTYKMKRADAIKFAESHYGEQSEVAQALYEIGDEFVARKEAMTAHDRLNIFYVENEITTVKQINSAIPSFVRCENVKDIRVSGALKSVAVNRRRRALCAEPIVRNCRFYRYDPNLSNQ